MGYMCVVCGVHGMCVRRYKHVCDECVVYLVCVVCVGRCGVRFLSQSGKVICSSGCVGVQ